MYLRCFIAIGIPGTVKKNIQELIENLKKYDVDVKWVVSENLHMTLKFLGNTSEVLLPGIVESLSKIALHYEPFYIKIKNIGMFPNRRYPKVLWIGVEESNALGELQRDIENAMSLLGFHREDKKFHPHLTFGRVRSQKGMANLLNELDAYTGKEFGSIIVGDIKLMRSELKPAGAQYYCMYEIKLWRKT